MDGNSKAQALTEMTLAEMRKVRVFLTQPGDLVYLYDDYASREVGIINICRLIGTLFADDDRPSYLRDYAEVTEAIKAWCDRHGAHYYADPREDFFVSKGARQARELGLKFVVVEDLS